MMLEWPAAEEAMATGGLDAAREVVPRCSWARIPEPSEADEWVIRLWLEMRSPLAQGSQLTLLLKRLRWAGLPDSLEEEVWLRVSIAERELGAWQSAMHG